MGICVVRPTYSVGAVGPWRGSAAVLVGVVPVGWSVEPWAELHAARVIVTAAIASRCLPRT